MVGVIFINIKQIKIMKKKTTEEFIKDAFKVHSDKYDYSKVEYKNKNLKVCIICLEHGEFWQRPSDHLQGCGCPKCGRKNSTGKKVTTEDFIIQAKEKYGNKYDYSKTVYNGAFNKVCIICPEHGEFFKRPDEHLRGGECKKCHQYKIGDGKYNTEIFILKSKLIHGDKYNYSNVKYKNSTTKVCIICPEHGEFWQNPDIHLQGSGCPICAKMVKFNKCKKNFVKTCRSIHKNKYDYSKAEYNGWNEKVCIICPIHGEFWQTPNMHLRGNGCPKCKNSKLEIEIEGLLLKNNITFIEKCTKNVLPWLNGQHLDFYLPDYKLAIECQGLQHFKPVEHFGGESEFLKNIDRDLHKKNLCTKNDIKLLYYTNENYNDFLGEKLYKTTNEILDYITEQKTSDH